MPASYPRTYLSLVSMVAILLSPLASPGVRAQDVRETTVEDRLAMAMRLLDEGAYVQAAEVLTPYVAAHPEDVEAARRLGQLLYWAGHFKGARQTYEEALRYHGGHPGLLLDYASMLVELYDERAARPLLESLQREAETATEASFLLATLDYWSGDLSRAVRGLSGVLERAPEHARARQFLLEIRTLTAPLLSGELALLSDNQPLRRGSASLTAEIHVTPLRTVAVTIEPAHFDAPATPVITMAAIRLRQAWPRARLRADAGGGLVLRTPSGEAAWMARASLGLRPAPSLYLAATAERAPYLTTRASLTDPVMAWSGRLHLDLEGRWKGKIAAEKTWYPDDNAVATAYAWLLAPVLQARPVGISLGYGFSYQDARASRFVWDAAGGAYSAYHTPEQARVHSALGLLTLRPSSPLHLEVNASYGFHASDVSPFSLIDSPALNDRPPARRRYTPWTLQGVVRLKAAAALEVIGTVAYSRTVYYAATRLGLQLTYRFIPFT